MLSPLNFLSFSLSCLENLDILVRLLEDNPELELSEVRADVEENFTVSVSTAKRLVGEVSLLQWTFLLG